MGRTDRRPKGYSGLLTRLIISLCPGRAADGCSSGVHLPGGRQITVVRHQLERIEDPLRETGYARGSRYVGLGGPSVATGIFAHRVRAPSMAPPSGSPFGCRSGVS